MTETEKVEFFTGSDFYGTTLSDVSYEKILISKKDGEITITSDSDHIIEKIDKTHEIKMEYNGIQLRFTLIDKTGMEVGHFTIFDGQHAGRPHNPPVPIKEMYAKLGGK